MSGAGALCAPFSATQFARLKHWSFQYFTSLGIACLSMILQFGVFRMKNQDGETVVFLWDYPLTA